MHTKCMDVAQRAREFVGVVGPDAADYLQRMVSNDVEALAVGEACPALLLTAKARVIAPLVVWRRGDEDFLVLTEPELGETLRSQLLRARFAAKCELEPEEHVSTLVLGGGDAVRARRQRGKQHRVLDAVLDSDLDGDADLERLRIEAATPRFGRELDDRVLPAEAGLDARAISFSKGCYPGQEPVARLHFRGHPNRGLRVVELDDVPDYDALLLHDGREVGRVTSAARREDGTVVALAYVRVEVPDDAALAVA